MRMNWYYASSIVYLLWCLDHFKEKSLELKHRYLYRLSQFNLIAYIFNLWYFAQRSDALTLLPLQLCNIGVLITPFALKLKKAFWLDFLFYACGLGALVAILIVSKEYYGDYSLFTLSFYVFHFLIFIIPTLAVIWGLHPLHPNFKRAKEITLVLIVLSIALHFLNLYLNRKFGIPANYFFTLRSLAVPTNPLFKLFATWIPLDYFYMYPVFIILYGYMAIIAFFIHHPASKKP